MQPALKTPNGSYNEVRPADPADGLYRQALARWEVFEKSRKIDPTLSAVVTRSWQRCAPRLNPRQPIRIQTLSTGILQAADAHFSIRMVGRRAMEDLFEQMEEAQLALVLVNHTGYLVDIVGKAEVLEYAARFGYARGALVTEAHLGTNAFALTLAEGVPTAVWGPEHFLQALHPIWETAAPIFDPAGRPLGCFGLVGAVADLPTAPSPVETASPPALAQFLSLAYAGAQMITAQRATESLLLEHNQQISLMTAILETSPNAILIWNGDGRLVQMNGAAEQIIGTPVHALMGKHYREFFALSPWLEEALRQQEELTNTHARVRLGNRQLDLALTVRYIQANHQLQNVVLTIEQESPTLLAAEANSSEPKGARGQGIAESITGISPAIRRVRNLARAAAGGRAPVLILGGRGAGKNSLAAAIHQDSPRSDEPLVIMPCSSLPQEQMTPTLLGFEEGWSPRDPWGKPGKFELAQGGTIYFQDIEYLTLEAQAHLLEIIESGIVRRLSGHRPMLLDVRIIASSSANLEKRMEEGAFRHDLYYALNTFEIRLPSLAERREDIPMLAEEILKRLARQFNETFRLTSEAIDILAAYTWPGNLREFEAVLRLACSQAGQKAAITAACLPDFVLNPNLERTHGQFSPGSIHKTSRSGMPALPTRHISLNLQDMEREALIQSAYRMNGNLTRMANLLGISRTTLWRKLRAYEISVDDFRSGKEPVG